MSDTIEIAGNGRAKCRACGQPTPKGELRFGERVPNPFAEGEAELTYWFHVPCAAYRRCEPFAKLDPVLLADVPDGPHLRTVAELGVRHYRLPRIAGLELAKSGRAKCRHCRETIEGKTLRIVLSFWEEGRFSPMGFVHATCASGYFDTTEVTPWLEFAASETMREHADAVAQALAGPVVPAVTAEEDAEAAHPE